MCLPNSNENPLIIKLTSFELINKEEFDSTNKKRQYSYFNKTVNPLNHIKSIKEKAESINLLIAQKIYKNHSFHFTEAKFMKPLSENCKKKIVIHRNNFDIPGPKIQKQSFYKNNNSNNLNDLNPKIDNIKAKEEGIIKYRFINNKYCIYSQSPKINPFNHRAYVSNDDIPYLQTAYCLPESTTKYRRLLYINILHYQIFKYVITFMNADQLLILFFTSKLFHFINYKEIIYFYLKECILKGITFSQRKHLLRFFLKGKNQPLLTPSETSSNSNLKKIKMDVDRTFISSKQFTNNGKLCN